MAQFFKFLFASCLGTILACLLLFFILIGIGSASMMKQDTKVVQGNAVLKINLPAIIPEQTNNVAMTFENLADDKILGVHDYAKAIIEAAADPRIKAIYISSSINDHGYATLKIIRDALLEFKQSGKHIIAYSNYLDHKNYFIHSTAHNIYLHPLGFLDLKGFGITIPFYKDFLDKAGIKYNIYYAGEFKSATEPFRLTKMSKENKLQLSEYIHGQFDLYLDQVAASRNLDKQQLSHNFNQFISYTPQKAYDNKLVDSLAHEADAIQSLKYKIGLNASDKINYITPEDYFESAVTKTKNIGATNKIAVVFAEGVITETKGQEGEIGRKYIKILRDIRANKNIKAIVLRVNSPGGSAILSSDILKELDLIRAEGKPIVVSMGDYAASGGYYISCHADSISASPHTLTGSIGVFAMIPNVNNLLEEKVGIDFDTVGTGPKATMFNLAMDWGAEEEKVIQENIDRTYSTFLNEVSSGRKMSKESVHEIAKGRIWNGLKAKENGLVNQIGELQDAINCAARLASLDKYRISEYPSRLEGFEKIIEMIKGTKDDTKTNISNAIAKQELGELYPYYKSIKEIQSAKGIQMRLPVLIKY